MKQYLLLSLIFFFACFVNFSGDPSKDENPGFETETEALDALHYVSSLSAYPNVDVIPGRFFPAYTHYRSVFSNAAGSRGTAWENIGPTNVGGRTVSIAIDPVDTNIIYLGSASGGLWRSVTGGIGDNAWEYIQTGFPVLGVGAIAINPENSNEIFIGTGETYSYGTSTFGLITRTERGSFGMGILKSSDGGLTWQISLDWTYQENRGVWDILYDPDNSNTLFAATTEGVYKSVDGGENWVQTLNEKMAMDLDINPDNPNILFAGVGNLNSVDKGIYRSIDGGDTWNLLTGGGLPTYTHDGRISISHFASDPDILIAVISNAFSTRGIYKSVNGGDTWSELDEEEVMSYQGWYAKGTLIHPENDDVFLLGGVELWKSNNGGASIIQKTTYIGPESPLHPDIHEIIANPLNPNHVYILTDGGLFRSNDFGETYYACVDGYVTSQFYIGSISSQANDVGLGGLQDNFTQRYDGTTDWLAVIGGDGTTNAIDPSDDEIQYGAYQYANMLKSYDQGYSFYEQIFYPFGTSAFVAPFIISPSDPAVLFTGDTKLYRSDDYGDLFAAPNPIQADSGNVLLSIAVSTYTSDTVYYSAAGVSGRADIYRSFDGGETVESITNGLPDRYYRDIALNKNNANEVLVCLSGYGTPHLYRSVDAGDSWTDISGDLPDVPFHAVLFDPVDDSIIYAGNDFSVFVSMDKGATWSAMNEGWPDAAMVFDLYISPSDNQLMAATHGHGVYRTDLLGEEEQPVGIADVSNSLFTIFPTLVADELMIESNAPANSKVQLELFDINGNLLLKRTFSGSDLRINCNELPAGNYFIQLSGNHVKQVERIVKL